MAIFLKRTPVCGDREPNYTSAKSLGVSLILEGGREKFGGVFRGVENVKNPVRLF